MSSDYRDDDVDVTDGDSIVRSEEELQVEKGVREAGTVNIRKEVDTEPVELDVDLQRETARVTREPINEPVGEAALGEEEIEVPLREEEAVAQKQVVAKERIDVDTDVETERATVTDELRKERVDLDEDVG